MPEVTYLFWGLDHSLQDGEPKLQNGQVGELPDLFTSWGHWVPTPIPQTLALRQQSPELRGRGLGLPSKL